MAKKRNPTAGDYLRTAGDVLISDPRNSPLATMGRAAYDYLSKATPQSVAGDIRGGLQGARAAWQREKAAINANPIRESFNLAKSAYIDPLAEPFRVFQNAAKARSTGNTDTGRKLAAAVPLAVLGAVNPEFRGARAATKAATAGVEKAATRTIEGKATKVAEKKTTKAAKGAMGETSNLSTAIMESLDGVKIVKMENREAYEEGRVAAVIERRQRHLIKGSNARAMAAPATETFTTILVALVFVYAGWRAQSGAMTPGIFSGFLTALLAATPAFASTGAEAVDQAAGEGLRHAAANT